MKERVRKVNRILSVQKQLHQLAEWRLVSLQRKEAELETNYQDLVCFLNEGHVLPDLFSVTVNRRLKGLVEEKARVHAVQLRQADAVLKELQKVKQAERMVTSLSAEQQRQDDKTELESLGERLGVPVSASFRKA
jgi:hypothetical protein